MGGAGRPGPQRTGCCSMCWCRGRTGQLVKAAEQTPIALPPSLARGCSGPPTWRSQPGQGEARGMHTPVPDKHPSSDCSLGTDPSSAVGGGSSQSFLEDSEQHVPESQGPGGSGCCAPRGPAHGTRPPRPRSWICCIKVRAAGPQRCGWERQPWSAGGTGSAA